jgi:hypothetical protein
MQHVRAKAQESDTKVVARSLSCKQQLHRPQASHTFQLLHAMIEVLRCVNQLVDEFKCSAKFKLIDCFPKRP